MSHPIFKNLPLSEIPVNIRCLLLCGVFAACCWTLADMLLVGFVPQTAAYPLLATLDSVMAGDVDLAALMLGGSPQRLLWGVLPATFSIIFYFAAACAVYRLLYPSRLARICFALLACGVTLSPLSHAGFYFLGRSVQALVADPGADKSLFIALYNDFYRVLIIHWATSIGLSACGYLLLLFAIARGQSTLPRALACLTPVPAGIVIAATCSLFPASTVAAMIGGATFNLAQLVFYLAALYTTGFRQAA
ncbi:DUF6796 family protein [uncultured Cardiobacterium sp.]|uniref:DUF6796 family protein n=1 Tax=uncultured Cardiobacterium sp. TaxID=417619 RepID=UPI002624ECDD|nr:DUF6796 family protein [uncultured Cardiobacterium sp.]